MDIKKMRAAILVAQKKPLVIDEILLPDKLGVGQVLVKIHYSGICGSQLGEIDGAKGEDKYLPHLLGHEASGTVIEIGTGVKHVKEGDIVVLHWRKGLGIESDPAKYTWKDCKVNSGWITTFNEYSIVSENRITKVPEHTDLKIACLFGCAVTTGFGVVVNNAKLAIGESVVVFGSGGIGLNIIQASSLSSAYPIVAVDLFDGRLELAEKMGATHTINAANVNALEELKTLFPSNSLDCFIDNTGNPKIIELGYSLVKPQGKVVLVGVPKKGNDITIYSLPLHFGKTISGSHGGETIPQTDILKYLNLVDKKIIDLNGIITAEYNLDQINEAINDMRGGKLVGRCIIKM